MIRKMPKISAKHQNNVNNFKNNMTKLWTDYFWQRLTFEKFNWTNMKNKSTERRMKRKQEFKKSTEENWKYNKSLNKNKIWTKK